MSNETRNRPSTVNGTASSPAREGREDHEERRSLSSRRSSSTGHSGTRELPTKPRRNAFVPLLLIGGAVLGTQGLQTSQLLGERQVLLATYASQQRAVDTLGRLRGSLDSLAADTQRLADTGSASAQLLVDELRRRGVAVSPAVVKAASAVSR